MSTAVQTDLDVCRPTRSDPALRITTDGKFLRHAVAPDAGAPDERFFVKGVTYGTFAPDSNGYQFPCLAQVAEDFQPALQYAKLIVYHQGA